jgi:putative ABC transport system permease protein
MSGFRPGLVLQLFARSSRVQKKRAVLTIAAIAWGSLSLLLLLAFGEGLHRQLYVASRGMGEELAIFWPGETGRPWQGLPAGRPIRPRIEDVELIRERVPGLQGVVGEISNWRVVMTRGEASVTSHVIGVNQDYGEMRNHIPQSGGRFLNPIDHDQRRRVIFLGDALAEKVFGDEDPVGKQVELDRLPYTVVGVMKPKILMGNYEGQDEDHGIIPLNTYKAQYGRDRLHRIVIKPERPELMQSCIDKLHEVLGAKYGFDPEDERVFGIWNTLERETGIDELTRGIMAFLGVIGAMTLVVGGIGVANIMYAVVKERTREIGVKMALGARRGWITGPIVLEGMLYTLFGGFIGLLMAVGLITLLGMIPTEGNEALQMLGVPTLSPAIGIWSSIILGAIGLLAGYIPARRAAGIDPAETLRYE